MALPTVRKRLWTRQDFDRLIEAGAFDEDDRLELLDGELWELSPPGSRHVTCARLVERALQAAFGADYDARRECPFALEKMSQPQPDITVVFGGIRDYTDAHPHESLLMVEVSDTTLSFDRGLKLGAYARNSIPEYWILDLKNERLEVYREPNGERFDSKVTLTRDNSITPLNAPDATIPVADLLP